VSKWAGFKIVGDNVDKNLRPSFQRIDYQTVSLHYFQFVIGLIFHHYQMLCPINPDILLPSATDLDLLKQEFEVLVARYEISVFVYMYDS